jgi:hypothetical protein
MNAGGLRDALNLTCVVGCSLDYSTARNAGAAAVWTACTSQVHGL